MAGRRAPHHDDEFERAFDDLFDLAYRVVYRLVPARAVAEDMAQETLARVYVRWARVGPYCEAFTVRVASNLALSHLRMANRPRRAAAGREPERPLDHVVGTRLDLEQALRRLPRRQREVVTLRYLADLPQDAVASALGLTTGSVSRHTSRGLAALRITIGDDHDA
jgi:RNA polymerase sigma factor (sigma-70 family)